MVQTIIYYKDGSEEWYDGTYEIGDGTIIITIYQERPVEDYGKPLPTVEIPRSEILEVLELL